MLSVASSLPSLSAFLALAFLLWSAAGEPAWNDWHDRGWIAETSTMSGTGRGRVVDVGASPYGAVGRLKGTMTCTAAIIVHPRIIVTAAHCIASRNGTIAPSKLIFQPSYQSGEDLGRFEATVWAVGSQQGSAAQSVDDAANDWAILVLDRVPVGIRPLRLRNSSGQELTRLERQILMPNYAIDATGARSLRVDPACSVLGLAWNVLLHDCRASPGASGAPLLMRDGHWYAVVGIHTASLWGRNEEGRIAKLLGNSASGAWSFANALAALSRRLNDESAHDVAYHGH